MKNLFLIKLILTFCLIANMLFCQQTDLQIHLIISAQSKMPTEFQSHPECLKFIEIVSTTHFNNFSIEVSENTESINFYNNTNGALTYNWNFGDVTNSKLFESNYQITSANSNLQFKY